VDPLEFRLSHLTDKRMRRVLEAAAKQFGWKSGRTPSGRGVGVACAIYLGTYVATMAEVALDKSTGRVQVQRVVCAQDEGVIVNPDGSRQQIEGSITMGLGYALTEEVRFKEGEVPDRNFDTYEIPRFYMGAVIANAIYDAVSARLRQLPMTPPRIQQALKRG